ncbi:LGFP repeat-containing protein [Nonomuraea soli]|uniref:Uncharacterized protein with LGFP repeats n=1 Tax=Nonomuraea soli TaxID=1032476 RepID=A0A7W0CEZ5_9ACTN|nr:hypothetical protein [Nonomuraea soli]MBA2889784.1 uncharacterized protein with LGFP repeats [Nonomuraea soli]
MRALLAAAVAAAALITVTPAAQARTSACDPGLIPEPNSLIRRLWEYKGGENSAYRCPVTKEYGYADKRGSWQVFQYGKIVWSPNVSERMLLRVYRQDFGISFAWESLKTERYNVMWKTQNGSWQQWGDIRNLYMRINKSFFLPDGDESRTARVHFKVQGCNSGGFLASSKCTAWSYPIALDWPAS